MKWGQIVCKVNYLGKLLVIRISLTPLVSIVQAERRHRALLPGGERLLLRVRAEVPTLD